MALEDTSHQYICARNAEDGMDNKLIIDFGSGGKSADPIDTCNEVFKTQVQTNCVQYPASLGRQCHNVSLSDHSELKINSSDHTCCISNDRTSIDEHTTEDYYAGNVNEDVNCHEQRLNAESASVGCCSITAMNNRRLLRADLEHVDRCYRSDICYDASVVSTLNSDVNDVDRCAAFKDDKSIGIDYLPDLKKIQTDFENLLDKVPSAAKRELMINTFIVNLMASRNRNLQRIVLMEDAAREDSTQHTNKYEPISDGKIESSACCGLSLLPVERLTSRRLSHCQLAVSPSPSTCDSSVALNLTVPHRKTHFVSTAMADSWICNDGEACFMTWPESNEDEPCAPLSVSAPPPAHCNEWKSVRPRDFIPDKTFTPSESNSSSLSEVLPWTSNMKEASNGNYVLEDVGKKWQRDYSVDACTTLCSSSAVKPSVASHQTSGCDIVRGKQELVPLPVQLNSPLDMSSLCETAQAIPRSQLSLDSCNESAVAAAHAQLSRANENTLAFKVTSLSHFPGQPLTGSTFNVQFPVAPDTAVPGNYSSLLSVSDSCDDVPSPPKRYRSRKDPDKGYEKVHIKRPMNSFMCWAHIERPKLSKIFPSKNNADISRILGEKWRKMTPDEKKPFEELSVKHSAQLLEKHPDYRYRPRRKEKGGNGESKPGQKRLQHQLCNSDADPLTYAARSDYHYGAVAGLMSLNKSWIRICNVTKDSEPTSAAPTNSVTETRPSLTDRTQILPNVTTTSSAAVLPSAVSLTIPQFGQRSDSAVDASLSTFDGIQVNV